MRLELKVIHAKTISFEVGYDFLCSDREREFVIAAKDGDLDALQRYSTAVRIECT